MPHADLQRHACNETDLQSSKLSCHGWQGAVCTLSTVPMVDWVLLGSSESMKGQAMWQPLHAASLSAESAVQTHPASGRKSV